jgi:DNA-binding SARP family transcriptional activator
LLGGSPVGGWVDPHARRLDDLVATAALAAGDRAMRAVDPRLAEALGQRALAADPWSERAHRMVIDARFVLGDHDGARRAAEHALSVLADLGATPAVETRVLLRRIGVDGRETARVDLHGHSETA